jgi:hypothetical protein
VDLTDSLAIVIILWHEKYWEEFFPGIPRWIAGMFYLEPISKMSFGPIFLLELRFKSSTYNSMPRFMTHKAYKIRRGIPQRGKARLRRDLEPKSYF